MHSNIIFWFDTHSLAILFSKFYIRKCNRAVQELSLAASQLEGPGFVGLKILRKDCVFLSRNIVKSVLHVQSCIQEIFRDYS